MKILQTKSYPHTFLNGADSFFILYTKLLRQLCLKALTDSLDKADGVNSGSSIALAYKSHKVLGHDTVVKCVDTSLFKLICKGNKLGQLVKLTSLAERKQAG